MREGKRQPIGSRFGWAIGVAIAASVAAGCDSETPTRVRRSWPCPQAWIGYGAGGCGPAVVLCAPDGGGAIGACEGVDAGRARVEPEADAGVNFFRRPDGAIGGGWHEPHESGGPPAAGWMPRAGEGVPSATWMPTAGAPDCPDGWNGTGDQCTPVDARACPVGTFADLGAEAAGSSVLFVRAGLPDDPGANGTLEHPYAHLRDAIRAARPGAWINLAPGVYPDANQIRASVHLVGACAAGVELVSPADATVGSPPTLVASGSLAVLDLRNVTVRGAGIGVRVDSGAVAHLRNVRVLSATGAGFHVEGSGTRADADGLIVGDTRWRAAGTAPQAGVVILRGASLAVTRALIVGNAGQGVFASGAGASLALSGSIVRGTRPTPMNTLGRGVEAANGATIAARGVLIEDNREIGLMAGARGRVDISDSTVRRTALASDGRAGRGIYAVDDGTVVATRVSVDRNHEAGCLAAEGGSIALHECIVRGTLPRADGQSGRGITAFSRGSVVADRVLIDDNTEVGVYATVGGTIELTEGVVRATRTLRSGARGQGIATFGGVIRVARLRVGGNRGVGVFASDATGRVELSDAVIEGTLPATDAAGIGIDAQEGAAVIATRTRVVGNTNVGVGAVSHGTVVTLSESVIQDTASRADNQQGNAIAALDGAVIEAQRVLLVGNHEAAAIAVGVGSRVSLSDAVVRDTTPNVGSMRGYGLFAQDAGTLQASRVLVEGSEGAGAGVFGADSRLEVTDSIVRATRSMSNGFGGGGLGASDGGTAIFSRSIIEGSHEVGAFATNAGSVTMESCVVRATLPGRDGTFGGGLMVTHGGRIDARHVFIEDNREVAAAAIGPGSSLRFSDVLVMRMQPSLRGLGVGILATAGASLEGERIALFGTHGMAVGATTEFEASQSAGSSIQLRDVFVQGVGRQTVEFDPRDRLRSVGAAVAAGAYCGLRARCDIANVVVAGGGEGVVVVGGSLSMRSGVVTGQRIAGTRSGTAGGTRAEFAEMEAFGNVDDRLDVENVSLPNVSIEEPPLSLSPPQ